MGFPGGTYLPVQEMWETWVQSLGQEDPLEHKWQPTPVLLPRESHGQRSLMGCSLVVHKESDMTEVTLHVCTHSSTLVIMALGVGEPWFIALAISVVWLLPLWLISSLMYSIALLNTEWGKKCTLAHHCIEIHTYACMNNTCKKTSRTKIIMKLTK